MKDINLAKDTLVKEDLSFVLVKDGEILRKSSDSGIKPILNVYTNEREILEGSSISDKVIGKAAAMFLVGGKISNLHAVLISESALELLEKENISVSYDKKVPKILNRDMTDLCPMEKLSQGVDDPEILKEKIFEFFGGKR